MNTEIIIALIAIVSGGGLTAILNIIFEQRKHKREIHVKETDDRINEWKKISEKNESRIIELE